MRRQPPSEHSQPPSPEAAFCLAYAHAAERQTRLDLMCLVTKHLGTDAVDLLILNRASAALLGRILRTRRVIAENDPFLRHRFESLALGQFLDFRLFEQRFLDRRFARG